jgi:universal stress protein E
MRTILVATDFSPAAEQALEHAASLARRSHAALRVVHVIEAGTNPETAEHLLDVRKQIAEVERLDVEVQWLREGGLQAASVPCTGRAAEAILREAEAAAADLIVMGTGGSGEWRHRVLGSTTRRVVEHANCPVLAVHASDVVRERQPRRVLVATDFSAGARGAALSAARLFGLASEDSVVLAHAYQLTPTVTVEMAPLSWAEVDGALREQATAQLDREAGAVRGTGLDLRSELLDGYPVEALVRAAHDLDADLVVTGTLGRTGLAHMLLGSTAERVVERAPCPVLVVPAKAVAGVLVAESVSGQATMAGTQAASDEQC